MAKAFSLRRNGLKHGKFFSRKIPLTCEVKRNLFCNITRRVIRLAFWNTSMIQITKGEN